MKAPDKIFVRDFGISLSKMWTYEKGKKKDDVDLVYIHKEAILEWVRNYKKRVCYFLLAKERNDALDELINHIESL